MHETVALETSQRLHQHFVRDAVDVAPEPPEPVGALGEHAHNQRGPLVGNPIQRLPRRALRRIDVVPCLAPWLVTWKCNIVRCFVRLPWRS